MSFQQFAAHYQESALFAQFAAEGAGVPLAQVQLWMRVVAAHTVA